MTYCKRCGALDHYEADCDFMKPPPKKAKAKAKGKKTTDGKRGRSSNDQRGG